MAKSSTFYKQGKHNETVALLLNYFPTIAHNSEDRAVIAYMISQGSPKKRGWAGENGWLFRLFPIYNWPKKEYISLRSLAF
jgi:hypothetical protein